MPNGGAVSRTAVLLTCRMQHWKWKPIPCITIPPSDHSPKAVFGDKAVYWPTQKKDLAASYGRFMADDIGQAAAAELCEDS